MADFEPGEIVVRKPCHERGRVKKVLVDRIIIWDGKKFRAVKKSLYRKLNKLEKALK